MSEASFIFVESAQPSQPNMPEVFHLPKLKGYDVFEISVDEIQHLYSSYAFTSSDYTRFCLNRIQAVDPYLEAVIETNPDALTIAKDLDGERKRGKSRGPLHGIPVLVKDVGTVYLSSMHFYRAP